MRKLLPIIFLVAASFASCKKYLDKKPDIRLAVPTTLDHFQRLLNQLSITDGSAPGITETGSDNYYVSDADLLNGNYPPEVIASYKWEKDIWQGGISGDWSNLYSIIYISNVVLEGLKDFEVASPDDQKKWDAIYGHALFVRGISHYFLEETFGQPYKPSSIGTDLGIPLKLTANLASMPVRSTVDKVFEQIILDLQTAANLLPNTTATKNHPSKAAAFAMLARVYLTMQDYQKAGMFADQSLQIDSHLLDYADFILPPNPAPPAATSGTNPFRFPPPNDSVEVLYPSYQIPYAIFNLTTSVIDTVVYRSYANDDLRKMLFFRLRNPQGTYSFRGNYSGMTATAFSGPAVDEMYLTRAECYARAGNKIAAMKDLNDLLRKRWKKVAGITTYVDQTAIDPEDALRKVLEERRKELLIRGIRWPDLRRLNQDPRFAITLKRVVNGTTITLPPNDLKYTFPIPDREISLTGMQQNPR